MSTKQEDIGKLVLRVSVGAIMIPHGIAKLGPLTSIKERLAGVGLPEFIAYGVWVGELVAPVLMIIGLFTRPAAAIFAFNMVAAIALAHRNDIFALNERGHWAIELAGLYLFTSIAVMLLGPGKYSLARGKGWFA